MHGPEVAPVRSKLLILTAILIIVIVGLILAFWAGIFFPNGGKIEKIYFDSCEWSSDSPSGNITTACLHIANTGADELIISKVWVNGTLLASAEWECFPSLRLNSGDQGVLRITPSSITFQRDTTYIFTLETTARNGFSYSAIAGTGTQTQSAGLILIKENIVWSTGSISVVIRNTGTTQGKVMATYIGTSATNLTPVTMSPSSDTINEGASKTFTLSYSWQPNTRYYFKFTTDKPAILEFNEKSP